MSKFTEFKAYKKLVALAKSPFDLTKEKNLTAERIETYCYTSCGYKLLFGTERLDDEVIKTLNDLALESSALEKMAKMQSGEILNVIEGYESENRAVLHTATRDFFEHPQKSQKAAEAAKMAKAETQKLKQFIQEIDKEGHFTDLVMVGIGGSDLGPRANYLALQKFCKPNRRIHFISNVDPDDAALVMKGLDLNKTLVVVVSKSGTTLETSTNEELVKSHFTKKGLKQEKHFIAVTGQGSPMDNPQKYLKSFYIWDWIGGRYSSTSMVGGVMLSFAYGFDVYWEFLKGANAMDKTALNKNLKENLPLMTALLGIWNRNFLGYSTLAIIPYSQALLRYPAHLQQADMESNGKRIDKKGNPVDFSTGPVIWGEPGTNSQHSFFQLIHQGTDVIPIEFVGYKESQFKEDIEYKGTTSQEKLLANLFAQAIALATGKKDENPNKAFPGNRPSHILLGKQLNPFSLGALLSLFENKIAFQGFIWGINSFDQEGVQLGKLLANRILNRFAFKNDKEADQPFPVADAIIKQLDGI
jgi:glucose-6-phosphate isomerase